MGECQLLYTHTGTDGLTKINDHVGRNIIMVVSRVRGRPFARIVKKTSAKRTVEIVIEDVLTL